MNKWIIFIIIIGAVSLGGVVLRILLPVLPYNTPSVGSVDVGDAAVQVPDPVIQIANVSEYTIAPGVLVLHTDEFSMNFLNTQAPPVYESLAEVGDPSAVIASLKNNPNVKAVFEVGTVASGKTSGVAISRKFITDLENSIGVKNLLLSYMAMIMQTNDGVVWLNSSPYTAEGVALGSTLAEILDMGTEQNAPIGSGFAGGQPDPSRGAENIGNGTSTNEPVRHHPQFYDNPAVSTEIAIIGSGE